MLRIWVVGITTLLCFTLAFPNIAQSDAPYIYYHSDALNAFVIERADGTDSRTLGENVMPEAHNFISGPGWSPSGEWFAWTSAVKTQEYPGPEKIWIVSTDGRTRLSLLDHVPNAQVAVWSPNEDYLLVIDVSDERLEVNPHADVYIVDAANEQIVTHLDDMFLELGEGNYWTENGESARFGYLPLVDGQVQFDTPTYRILRTNGGIEDSRDPSILEARMPYIAPVISYGGISLSPNHRYGASFDNVTITDQTTHSAVAIRPFSGSDGMPCTYRWHQSDKWLLHEESMSFTGSGCISGGVSVMRADGGVQRELNRCWFQDQNCANWLPEEVIPHLGTGQPQSVILEPDVTLIHEGFVSGAAWRPDRQALATYEQIGMGSDSGRVNIWTFETGVYRRIQSFSVSPCPQLFQPKCDLRWNPSGTKIGLPATTGSQIISIDTGERISVEGGLIAGWIDDEHYILTSYSSSYDPLQHRLARLNYNRETRHLAAVEIIDLATDRPIYTLILDDPERFRWIESMVLVPGQNQLVIAANGSPPEIGMVLWDFETDVLTELSEFDPAYITNLAAFGNLFFGYGKGTLIYVYDLTDGSIVTRLNRYTSALSVSPDGNLLATAGGAIAEIWNLDEVIP